VVGCAVCLVGVCQALTRDEQNLISTHYSMNTAGFAYVGCFRDNPAARDLPVAKGASVEVTPASCSDLCTGYDYFGVQITECFCGNTYGSVVEPVHSLDYTTASTGVLGGQWIHPSDDGTPTLATAPAGISAIEKAHAQTAYETVTNTLGGVGMIDEVNVNKYIPEGCYHDCVKTEAGALAGTDAGMPCGGIHRNSVYRRPSTMAANCNSFHPLLKSRGICDPPGGGALSSSGALYDPEASFRAQGHSALTAHQPPCEKSDIAGCLITALGHEDAGHAYSKPWETHHQFQPGRHHANAPAREKDGNPPPIDADKSYMVHS